MKHIILTCCSILLMLPYCLCAAEDLSHITGAGGTVYFAHDFESQVFTSDSGAASITYSGGNINGSPGTGCSDTATYHNTIIVNDAAAQGAVASSQYALKTPYDGDCTGESTSRDMSTITGASFGPGDDCYVRWYQKFTGDWNSASSDNPPYSAGSQHKFTKFYNGNSTPPVTYGFHFSFSAGGEYGRNYMREFDNQFSSGTDDGTMVWVYADPSHIGGTITGADNYTQPGEDTDFVFSTDTWYCIEAHFRLNSASATADGEVEIWIDGEKIFGCSNIKLWEGSYNNVDTFEFQHIYFNRTATDQPTYMDNIVIADSYIGPMGSGSTPTCSGISINGGSMQ